VFFFVLVLTVERGLGFTFMQTGIWVYVYAGNLSFRETELTCLPWFNMAACCRRSR